MNPDRRADCVAELRAIAAELEASEMLWLERIAARLRALADRQESGDDDGS